MTKIEAKDKMKYAIAGLEREVWGTFKIDNIIRTLEFTLQDDKDYGHTLEMLNRSLESARKRTISIRCEIMDIIDQIDVHYAGVDGKGGGNDE